jgi:hypothetical protein
MDAALCCVRGKMLGVTPFHSQKQAKEYIVGRIVAEAQSEGVPLSEIERKMLYFSETDWAPPGMLDVNAEFERDYDDDAYEEKIAGLVRNLPEHSSPEEQELWGAAVSKLEEGDHYLLFLIAAGATSAEAGGVLSKLGPWLPAPSGSGPRPRGDLLRLIVAAFVVFALAVCYVLLRDRFR